MSREVFVTCHLDPLLAYCFVCVHVLCVSVCACDCVIVCGVCVCLCAYVCVHLSVNVCLSWVCECVWVYVCACVCVLQRMPASISPLMKCSFSFCRKGKFISLAFSHHHFCFNFL